jgi:deazaflavin-dependent oxidoreductase (nitroreductase family)
LVVRRSSRTSRLSGTVGTSRLVTRLHPPLYRITGGRGPFGRLIGMRFVIVETTGRRSGRRIDVPLFATPDGDGYILVASNGGHPREPAWAGNLRATPAVTVRVGDRRVPMRARELQDDDRSRAWSLAAAVYPGYDDYARWWAPRRISVFALEEPG